MYSILCYNILDTVLCWIRGAAIHLAEDQRYYYHYVYYYHYY